MLIIETTLARGALLYTQFLTEAMEDVLWEVSSCRPNPGLKRFITPNAVEKLHQMGFEIGGEASNFRKFVKISSSVDARTVADSCVRLLYDVFGYRGRTALKMSIIREECTVDQPVYDNMTVEDIRTLLRKAGYNVRINSRDESPGLTVLHGSMRFYVQLVGKIRKNEYQGCDLFAELNPQGLSDELLGQIQTDHRFIKVLVNESGEILLRASILRASILFAGGVTAEHILEHVAIFVTTVNNVLEFAQSQPPETTKWKM